MILFVFQVITPSKKLCSSIMGSVAAPIQR